MDLNSTKIDRNVDSLLCLLVDNDYQYYYCLIRIDNDYQYQM